RPRPADIRSSGCGGSAVRAETLVGAPRLHLGGEVLVRVCRGSTRSEHQDVAVGVRGTQIAGVPWGVARPIDLARAVRPGAIGERIELPDDGSDTEEGAISCCDGR